MHALPRALAGRGREGRRASSATAASVERILLGRRQAAPCAACASPAARCSRPTPSSCNADLPVAYRTLLPGLPAAARPRDGRVLAVGRRLARRRAGRAARRRRPPQHPLRQRVGRRRSEPLLARRHPHARPSFLVTVPDDRRAGDGARPAGTCCTCSSRYPTSTARRLDRPNARVPATTSAPRLRGSATRRRSRSSTASTRSTGRRRAWSGARRSGSRTRFFQTGPFRPANVEREGARAGVRRFGTVPGVGVPMVLVSGKLAAERVDACRTTEMTR